MGRDVTNVGADGETDVSDAGFLNHDLIWSENDGDSPPDWSKRNTDIKPGGARSDCGIDVGGYCDVGVPRTAYDLLRNA